MITAIEASLLAVAAAVKIHDFPEGKPLLRDVADELALGCRSLAERDRARARRLPAQASRPHQPRAGAELAAQQLHRLSHRENC
ncbi:MAG: hypothetical protein NTZ54_12410 [Alphaproteobacteria bacterium]|nr:hypothetical protein [Alphaproteobacteria bacterium]